MVYKQQKISLAVLEARKTNFQVPADLGTGEGSFLIVPLWFGSLRPICQTLGHQLVVIIGSGGTCKRQDLVEGCQVAGDSLKGDTGPLPLLLPGHHELKHPPLSHAHAVMYCSATGPKQPETKTSEAVSQNKPFLHQK